ncbi:MFS domain-containing protein [Caerostris extrusa]|uniref:MFS domain-containing protein n=1 Tax=Caerostris extrusa TaxID=172846 RepID=A0AAV4RHE9_CAEEX|nr:MFS domain-containing protein [Caerostris extrusa]
MKNIISAPFASILSQLIGPRKVALGGGLLAFVGLSASSFTPSLEYLYIFYGVVQGIAFTCTFTPGKDTLYPQEDSQNTSIQDDHTVSNKDSILIENFNFESGFDLSLESSVALKSSAPEIFVEYRDGNMYSSGPNLYSNKSCVPNSNKMIRGGSSPHLADIPKSSERTYGSSVSTESLPNMFKLAPRLLKHSSRGSSFIYLSSYSFGATAGAVLTKEHFATHDATNCKIICEDPSETKKPRKWKLFPCLRKIPIDLSIF